MNTDLKDRLGRAATILTATERSPSPELHDMGLRLLAKELNDLDRCTRERDKLEVAEFRAYMAASPSARPVSLICEESAERVRRIMGRGGRD